MRDRIRGIDPDVDIEDVDKERLTRIILKMTEKAGYQEHGSRFEKWILTVLAGLLVTAAGAGVALYAKVSALDERTVSIQSQVNEVKRIVEPRYRGSTSPP